MEGPLNIYYVPVINIYLFHCEIVTYIILFCSINTKKVKFTFSMYSVNCTANEQ